MIRIGFLAFIWIALLPACCQKSYSQKKTQQKNMMTQEQVVAKYLTHPDDWFLNPIEDSLNQIQKSLARESFEGIAIASPRRIRMDQLADFPLLLAIQRFATREWAVVSGANTRLLLVNLDDGEMRIVNAFQEGKRRYKPLARHSGEGPAPQGHAATAKSTTLRKINLTQAINYKWKPGRYSLRMLQYDWVSNEVRVDVVPSPQMPAEPVSRVSDAEVSAQAAGWKSSPDAFPNAFCTEKSPDLQGGKLALRVAPQSKSGASLPVHCAFDVAIPENCMLELDQANQNTSEFAALLPFGLYFARLDDIHPNLVRVRYPVKTVELTQGNRLRGCFAIDANEMVSQQLAPGKYLIYLIFGSHVSTAVAATIE